MEVDSKKKIKTETIDEQDYLSSLDFITEKIKKVLRKDKIFIQQEGKVKKKKKKN